MACIKIQLNSNRPQLFILCFSCWIVGWHWTVSDIISLCHINWVYVKMTDIVGAEDYCQNGSHSVHMHRYCTWSRGWESISRVAKCVQSAWSTHCTSRISIVTARHGSRLDLKSRQREQRKMPRLVSGWCDLLVTVAKISCHLFIIVSWW